MHEDREVEYRSFVAGKPGTVESTNEQAEGEAAGLAKTRWRLGDLALAGTTVARFVAALEANDHRTVAVLLRERAGLATALGSLVFDADRLLLFGEQLASCCEGASWGQADAGRAAQHAIDRMVLANLSYRSTRRTFMATAEPPAVTKDDAAKPKASAAAGPSAPSRGAAGRMGGHVPDVVTSHGRPLTVCASCGMQLLDVDQALAPCKGPSPVTHQVVIDEGLRQVGEPVVPPSPGPREQPHECVICSARLSGRVFRCPTCGARSCSGECAAEHAERRCKNNPARRAPVGG